MKLIVMGQQAFGKDCLEKLIASDDDVVAVYCEPDREGKPVDPIKEYALEQGLPVEQPADFKDQAVLDQLASYDADLMIMAFVNIFVPEAARDTPKQGSICFHPSLLPLHRGPSAVNWPIIMGSTKSGYSWFYPNDGLDEGDSLLQWECHLFRDGNPPHIVPDESLATYERRCTKKHAKIDWNKPVGQVYNLIRGTNPAPGAWTTLNGAEVQIYDCEPIPGDGVSSKVVDISKDGVSVQLIGGRITIKRVRPAGSGKMSALDWATETGLEVGHILGT